MAKRDTITYRETELGKGIRGLGKTNVYMGKKLIGSIFPGVHGGWFYKPIGTAGFKGETFPTIEGVKRSIEGR